MLLKKRHTSYMRSSNIIKGIAIVSVLLLSIVGCKRNQSANHLYLECSRTLADNGKQWITKYDINIKANTVDFYSQLDSFSKPVRYGLSKVSITDSQIIIFANGEPLTGNGETTIDRSTWRYKFKYPHGATHEASCKKISDFN